MTTPRSKSGDPALDVEDAPPVERVVVIAASPRSGSTLLGSLLANAHIGVPLEYLNPEVLVEFAARWGVPRPSLGGQVVRLRRLLRGEPRWKLTKSMTKRSLLAYLDLLARHRTTPNGVFSMKVIDLHLVTMARVEVDFDHWGPAPSFVYIERRDRVAQAVSWHRAQQDRAWSSEVPREASSTLRYDEAAIQRRLDTIDAGRNRWETYFTARSIEPIRVFYEDLDTDYEPVTRRLFEELGFPDLPVQPPRVQRQRDETNDEWVSRFRGTRT
jgi:trehalose 2-sulfotransferase